MQGSEIGREAEEIVKSGGEFAIPALGCGCGTLADTSTCACNNTTLIWSSFRPCRRMFLFVGLVSDELMLKIIQSELDKLHGKASPPSLFLLSLSPEVVLFCPKSFQTTSGSTSYIAHPMTSHLSPPIK
jgi:hypothetical protein